VSRDDVTFRDHFSALASSYAEFRPSYPPELFTWLASVAPGARAAWDCGAGSGQASVELARHFAHVFATDASTAQLSAAIAHPNVEYRVSSAEACGLDDASVDLVTVAQALHWFDLDRFYAEVRRVTVPRGVIAVWTYNLLIVDGAEIDALVSDFYWNVAGPYWPPERRHVDNGYSDLPFPFEPIAVPPFSMRAEWSFDRLLGYVGTWSASARMVKEEGTARVEHFAEKLRRVWGESPTRNVEWPLSIRAGRV
jgi:SAM-dependent methyltransferase